MNMTEERRGWLVLVRCTPFLHGLQGINDKGRVISMDGYCASPQECRGMYAGKLIIFFLSSTNWCKFAQVDPNYPKGKSLDNQIKAQFHLQCNQTYTSMGTWAP
jgi:hypothetical protein